MSYNMVIQTGFLKRRTPIVATTKLGSDIYGTDFNRQLASSIATNSQGNMLVLGAAGNFTFKHGEVLLMKWNGTDWVTYGWNYKINGTNSEGLGNYVDMNAQGDKIIIGGPSNPGGGTARGRAYVYFFNTATDGWSLKLTVDGTSNQDNFGSVCMNAVGDIVGVGTTSSLFNGIGYIKIYKCAIDETWTQLGLTIVGEAAGDNIGRLLKMNDNGDVIVFSVGNKVRTYYWNGVSWIKRGSDIVGVDGTIINGIPESLALNSDGNIMAFGCNNSGRGAIVTYSWDGTTWQQMGSPIVISIDSTTSTNFGFGTISLNAAGNILAAYVSNSAWNSSHSSVYRWNGTRWESLIQSIPPPVAGNTITSINLNPVGNKLVIGVGGNSTFKTNAGLVRVYDISI